MPALTIVLEPGPGEVGPAITELLSGLGVDLSNVEFVIRPRRRRPASVAFAIPRFTDKQGGHGTSMLSIPNDAIATVKLLFQDDVGAPLSGNLGSAGVVGVTVTDPTVATAVLSDDGQSVTITPLVLTGSSTLTYTDTADGINAGMDFTIVAPAPHTVSFDEAHVTFVRNPNPPT